jgi:hypothetical protein
MPWQSIVVPLTPLMLATSQPSLLTCPVIEAVRPFPPTSVPIMEKVLFGLMDPVTLAIIFMLSQATNVPIQYWAGAGCLRMEHVNSALGRNLLRLRQIACGGHHHGTSRDRTH